MKLIHTGLIVLSMAAGACSPRPAAMKGAPTTVKKEIFGKTADGTPVDIYTLTNKNGLEARIMTYGGALVSLSVPDRAGKPADIVLGFDTLDGYLPKSTYFGALIGRYGNRIAGGKFTLEGRQYTLALNNGPNALHGGLKGFDRVVWEGKDFATADTRGVELSYLSKDGEEGYPGDLSVKVVYTLTDNNELKLDYSATTDKPTVLNLTNHSFFNLAGAGTGDVLKHVVTLNADRFTPVNKNLIPTGELRPVKGTPFDFTAPHAIGERIDAKDEQIAYGPGYDHNFVLNGPAGTLAKAAEVYEPNTGRVMELSTTEPGLQFYTGNFLDGTAHGKGGKVYQRRSAFCMETQHYPDSPNHPEFPTTELKPGSAFHSTTVYKFSAR